jgi:predicted CoA-binding protein
MDQSIKEFVKSKRLAIVGVSRASKKFSNAAYTELRNRGYQVFGVNPALAEIAGERCYKDLTSLCGQVDGAVVCVSPEKVEPILREASSNGLRNIWLQQGAESEEAVNLGKSLGLNIVSGKCILMYAEPVHGFHSFHRFFVRLSGRL